MTRQEGAVASAVEREALLAWERAASGVDGRPPAALRPLKFRPQKDDKCVVFLLESAGRDGEDVIAKRCPRELAAFARRIYEELLPRSGARALRVYGVGPAERADRAWLFLEPATGRRYDRADAAHRVAMTGWLAGLHRGLASVSGPDWLPRREADFYLCELRTALRELRNGCANPVLEPADVELLRRMTGHLSAIERAWGDFWCPFEGVPSTLVHLDLVPKNVRVDASGMDIRVFDWEYAGWGVPAVDLLGVDGREYVRRQASYWPGCTADQVRALGRLGRVLRTVMATSWAAKSLRWPWVERPLRNLSRYVMDLDGIERSGLLRAGRASG